MMKKFLCVVYAACLVLVLSLPAMAVEETGAVDVVVRRGRTPVEGCKIELFWAGQALEEGYRLEKTFGGGVILMQDVFSPDLARWMAEGAENGLTGQTDSEGRVTFRELPFGLYLVVDQEGEVFAPYLVSVSQEFPYIDTYPQLESPAYTLPRTGMPGPVESAMLSLPASLAGLMILFSRKIRKSM